VGAFPEPFLHGYGGKRRPTAVVYDAFLNAGVRAIARVIGAELVTPNGRRVPEGWNVFFVSNGIRPRFHAGFCGEGGSAGDAVCFKLVGQPRMLVQDPDRVRFRDQVVPWP
jgi:hypothetical protein